MLTTVQTKSCPQQACGPGEPPGNDAGNENVQEIQIPTGHDTIYCGTPPRAYVEKGHAEKLCLATFATSVGDPQIPGNRGFIL